MRRTRRPRGSPWRKGRKSSDLPGHPSGTASHVVSGACLPCAPCMQPTAASALRGLLLPRGLFTSDTQL